MNITLLLFGAATDLLGTSEITLEVPNNTNIASFKTFLNEQFSTLSQLNSYAIAVNEAYANDTVLLKENDVVAIIPPVSGG
ncbi:Molybdopterin synthase sulfur carrier subunit [Tenacibaculum sp. 190130A14a]|uniref:Molybdopterin synthase sulfur carrier subunit n=1 Tax=Tenacibaculum polynesiense TaxID=3137857 RepID=A0ABM9PEB7_9FLAO